MGNALYDPFYTATRDVFELMLNVSHIAAEPETRPVDETGSLDVEIAVVGDLEGRVVYHFPRRTMLEMVKVLSGMDMDTVDDFVISAMSEIANIISGNVMSEFSRQSIGCDIRPPKVVRPEEEAAPAADERVAHMLLHTDVGEVGLDIRLRMAKAG